MRPLTPAETRLLALLLGTLGIAGSLVLLSIGKRLHAGMDRELLELRNAKIEAEAWRDERPLWEERAAWLEANQPKFPTDGNPSSALIQKVQDSASAHGLALLEQSIAEPANTPHYREVAVRVKVQATLEQLTRWLVELQQPKQFQAVTAFAIRSDKEPPKVVCEVQIARWYAP